MSNNISLIIAFYNGSKFLNEAIASAVHQTVKFHEIIIVNDGSDADEKKWLNGVKNEFEFDIKIIHRENGGQGAARNDGVLSATGEYVCFLDQDDTLLPEHNQLLLSEINHQPYPRGWVYGNFHTCNSVGEIFSRNSMPGTALTESSNIYQFLDHDLFILPSATIIHRKAFLDVGGFDAQFKGYEDDDLFVRLFISGVNYKFLNKPVYSWRMHDNQTSGTIKMSYSRMRFIKKWIQKYYETAIDNDHLRLGIMNRFERMVILDYINCKKKENRAEYKNICIDFYKLFFPHKRNRSAIYKFLFIKYLPQRAIRLSASFYMKFNRT